MENVFMEEESILFVYSRSEKYIEYKLYSV